MSPTTLSLSTLPDWIGKTLGTSPWHLVDQARIDQFAACTEDHQWIHVDVERARRESPFGAPVAHGFLTLSLLAAMNAEIGTMPVDAAAVFNYGFDKVRFLSPVKAGGRVRAHAVLQEVSPQAGGRLLLKLLNTVEIEGESKPAVIAEILALVVPPTA